MVTRKLMVIFTLLSVFLLVLTACAGETQETTQSTLEPEPESQSQSQSVQNQPEAQNRDLRLLAWFGNGSSPMDYQGAGVVGYLNDDGTIEPAIELSGSMNNVHACGNQSTSADGTYFAFMVGQPVGGDDGAKLYQVTHAEMPVPVDDIQGLTCLSGTTLRYGDDTLIYIDYEVIPEGAEYAKGQLRVRDSASLEEQFSANDVVAFNLEGDSVAYISFFNNARNQADEAGVYIWNGAENGREVATLFPESNCRFVSASLASTGTVSAEDSGISQLAIVMGERCPSGGTNWKIYTVDAQAGTSTLELSGTQNGGFFPQSGTNRMMSLGDGSHILFTTADGLTRNSANVYITPLDTISTDNRIVERGAVMSRHTLRRLNIENNAPPAFSPDGRWMAMAVVSGIDPGAIVIVDLTAPDSPPVEIPIPDTNDRVPMLRFAPAGSNNALYYVLGLLDGKDNALYRVDMDSLTESRVTRGQFQTGIVQSADSVTLLQWRDGNDYVDLLHINGNNAPTTLYEGAIRDAEGEVESTRFAYPLSWR